MLSQKILKILNWTKPTLLILKNLRYLIYYETIESIINKHTPEKTKTITEKTVPGSMVKKVKPDEKYKEL